MKKTLSIITVFVIVLSMFSTMMSFVEAQTNEWSEPQQLTTDPAEDYGPSIMQDSNGKIWLVWARRNMSGDPKKLWFKTSSDGGVSWSTPQILVPDALDVIGTSLLQDSTGKIWVAWSGGYYPSDFDIFYITSDDGGLSWSPPQHLTDAGDNNTPSLIEVSDEVWIVWRRSHDAWYRKTNNGGATWSDPIQLTSHTLQSFTPGAMVDSTGKIWIAWTRNKDVYYKTSIDDGTSWSPDQQLTTYPNDDFRTNPFIIEDVSGKIYIFYNTRYFPDILYKTTTDGGGTWSAPQELTADTYGNGNPYAALINNEIWVVWKRHVDVSDYEPPYDVDIWMSKTSPPISWEYVFEDRCRGTMLKISTDDKFFQFIAPGKIFSVKHDPNMIAGDHYIAIDFEDTEIKLYAIAIITRRWSFCITTATDVEKGTRYWLIDINWHWGFSLI